MGSTAGGARPLLYVPTDRLWNRIMPDWAKQRRVEIIHNVQARTTRRNFVLREYDTDSAAEQPRVVNQSR